MIYSVGNILRVVIYHCLIYFYVSHYWKNLLLLSFSLYLILPYLANYVLKLPKFSHLFHSSWEILLLCPHMPICIHWSFFENCSNKMSILCVFKFYMIVLFAKYGQMTSQYACYNYWHLKIKSCTAHKLRNSSTIKSL